MGRIFFLDLNLNQRKIFENEKKLDLCCSLSFARKKEKRKKEK